VLKTKREIFRFFSENST